MKKLDAVILLVVVAAFAAVVGWRATRPAPPTPGVFAQQVRLDAAIAESAQTGRPVVALATADWCPPCRVLKRNALTDGRVVALLGERTIPVYVDVDRFPEEARQLGASSIPTTYVIRNGEITAKVTGALGPDDYLGWLETAIGG